MYAYDMLVACHRQMIVHKGENMGGRVSLDVHG